VAKPALNGVFQRIRSLAAVHTSRDSSDRQLLARFLQADDEAAFTLLVDRHGPMVLGLCRRVLRHKHDADDACQATFLVLARKAASLRKQESLSSWLHGVAYRISANLKRQHARRQRREQQATRPSARPALAQAADGDITWRELQTVLDEELERLPERYRAPLILCYLEGKTRDEAAQQLGAKPGALHGLLERGRKLLRDRLTRRGLTLSAALVGAALTETAAKAALAPAFAVASAQAALALARGQTVAPGLIAPQVLSLVKEASKIMLVTKIKIGAALVVCAGMLTAVMGGSLDSVSLAQDNTRPAAKPQNIAQAAKTESDEEFIRRISKDLRGSEPSPTEVHFFASSKDANRRQKLIDLFIQERQAKEKAQAQAKATTAPFIVDYTPNTIAIGNLDFARPTLWSTANVINERNFTITDLGGARLVTIQGALFQDLAAVKEKKEVATITQKYLDQLLDYVKANPKNADVADAMLHIGLVYRAQGKTVEADAWQAKLLKEHPKSSAASMAQEPRANVTGTWIELWQPYNPSAATINRPAEPRPKKVAPATTPQAK
jgi:RNA polymerase sigma factor (sigma-70 family)